MALYKYRMCINGVRALKTMYEIW